MMLLYFTEVTISFEYCVCIFSQFFFTLTFKLDISKVGILMDLMSKSVYANVCLHFVNYKSG